MTTDILCGTFPPKLQVSSLVVLPQKPTRESEGSKHYLFQDRNLNLSVILKSCNQTTTTTPILQVSSLVVLPQKPTRESEGSMLDHRLDQIGP